MTTIVLPISRKEYLMSVFNCLNHLLRPAETELLIITDGDEELEDAVQSLLDMIHFNRIQVINFGDGPGAEIKERRWRIAEIHNFAKQHIPEGTDRVFLIEDDTVFSQEALGQLTEVMNKTGAAFVQGVEVGRWKTPYIGGWIADDLTDPKRIVSVKPGEGVQDIDAGGLYCALVDANEYLDHQFKPYEVDQEMKGLGCDVNFGISLKRQGKAVLMNWDVQCGHYKDGIQLRLESIRPVVIVFEKNENNRWLASNHWADMEQPS